MAKRKRRKRRRIRKNTKLSATGENSPRRLRIPIQDFSSVAGSWKGISIWRGASSAVWSEQVVIVIEEDVSYTEDDTWCPTGGVMRIVDGKIQYDGYNGLVVTVTLYEGNGKRVLKGKRQDTERTFKVKPANGKRKKMKGKKRRKRRNIDQVFRKNVAVVGSALGLPTHMPLHRNGTGRPCCPDFTRRFFGPPR